MDYLDEIVGQETAKHFLRNALKKNRIYNLLLAGPRGVGKRMAAFALAKTLGTPPNSQNFMLIAPVPPSNREKEKDEKIFEHMKTYLPENPVVQIEDNATIVIRQIRNLIEWLLLMPAKGTNRVVIILEADRMNEESANSFLKTLEEPPLDTIFILTSSRPDYLIPTIRSRCQTIKFSYLNNLQIQNIIYGETDSFCLGSPGEISYLKENRLFQTAQEIFRKAPLSLSIVAKLSKELEKEKIADLLYSILLLYRCVLYKNFNNQTAKEYEADIVKKARRVSQERVVNAIFMLNNYINLLEHNPNNILLLFNVLSRLP
ncbi:MAG: AAA family ATPase [candidate division WOR-3 bacterium]